MVMLSAGAGPMRWAVHLVVGLVGFIVFIGVRPRLAAMQGETWWRLALVAVVCLAATLAMPGIDGVHRWLVLGAVRIPVSSLVTPLLLVAAAGQPGWSRVRAHGLLFAMQMVHVLQPDHFGRRRRGLN
jgi:cell division protein FtsW (lipid II flippase)